MSEYGCKECPENCRASANKKPIYCLYSGVDRARWREVTADTPPKLTAEEKLPDWCKVGAWVWWKGASDIGYAPGYMKITGISNEIINCDAIQGIPIAQNQIFEARLHPWTDDELKQQVGKPFIFSDGSIVLCLAFADDTGPDSECGLKFADEDGGYYTAKELINANIRQLDNTPCGVLEHRDGEGWVR